MTLRGWALAAIPLLYVVSLPWYRAAGAAPAVLFGLPDWVVVALACYAGIAVLNAAAWLATEVRDPGEDP